MNPVFGARVSFFDELKRRNVIRLGALYLVSAWLLLQLTDVLSSLLPVPEWAGSLVIMLLALGFLPALIFAWVYEMTPEGLRREVDVDRSQSITHATGRKINTLIVVLLFLAIGGLVADRLIPEQPAPLDADLAPAVTASEGPSIAVLPFSDLSPGQDQQYFTDGLTEELLNLLVRVDGLRIASRTSSFAYRDSSLGVPEISRALNVGHILEGSVRKDGDRLRITAQLIDAGTDRHLWSENFDRELDDIFRIQDEIANSIVAALSGKLGVGKKPVKVEAATDNLDAYEMYLKARELFIKRERLAESISLFQGAIELDPGFARAWEGLAAVEVVADDWLPEDGIDHEIRAKEAAERALELNPDLSMPLAVLGSYESDLNFDMIAAKDYFDAALARDPKNTTAWLWRGLRFKVGGYTAEAIADFKQCLAIDPGYLNCQQHLAEAYLHLGDVDLALRLNNQVLEHNFHSISEAFVPFYVRRGQRELGLLIADIRTKTSGAPVIEWIRALENPNGINRDGYVRLKDWERQRGTEPLLSIALPHVLLTFRDYDELVANARFTAWVLWHPDAEEFRKSPQFKALIRKRGIYDYWKVRGFPPQCRRIGNDDFECGNPIKS